MRDRLDRRRVMEGAGASLVSLGLASLAGCAAGPAPTSAGSASAAPGKQAGKLEATEIAPGVKLITGAGANVLAVRSPEGALLVDGGLAENAPGLIERALRETGAGKVASLINTHWHPEQTGANDL